MDIIENTFIYKAISRRLCTIQAAILNIKLKYLYKENNQIKGIAKKYLKETENKKIQMLKTVHGYEHVWYLFTMGLENREKFQNYLKANNIQTSIQYTIPSHRQLVFSYWNTLYFQIFERIHN